MLITKANQPGKGYPKLMEPVNAEMSVEVKYYAGENDLRDWLRPFYCERVFANTILRSIGTWCVKWGFKGFVHIGCYNARKARHLDGTLIKPTRWSNHAYGLAVDFKGILDEHGNFVTFKELRDNAPMKWNELLNNIKTAIEGLGNTMEVKDEGNGLYIHLGIWHK